MPWQISSRGGACDQVSGIKAVVAVIKNWLTRRIVDLRHVTGDDAYERYLAHHRQHHADQVVLDRRDYYLAEQQRKWSGVKRCC